MGYASWTSNYDPELSLEEKQWQEPLILRFNDKQIKAFMIVDIDNQTYYADIKPPTKFDAPDFSEVEIALPIDCGHTVTSYNSITRQYDTIEAPQSCFNLDDFLYGYFDLLWEAGPDYTPDIQTAKPVVIYLRTLGLLRSLNHNQICMIRCQL
jgi:hypothetical protein